jgi:hypothetical protein
MTVAAARLAAIGQQITDKERSIASLVAETEQLRALAENFSRFKFTRDCDINAGKTQTANGLAVSIAQAAFCAREPLRTAAFIKGLDLAVQRVLKNQTRVNVLYAGCGPYALLALVLMTRYTPEQLQFSLLELHPQTLAHACELIRTLGLEAYISQSECVDASRYDIPRNALPDILLSETMNNALGKEPQVAILRNLSRQAPHALLVPQAVHVHLGSAKAHAGTDTDTPPDYDDLGRVFTLDAIHIAHWQDHGDLNLPAYSITLPGVTHRPLYFLTRIQTFGTWQLREQECSLNLPQKLRLPPDYPGKTQLDFHYRLGAYPGLFLK